MGRIGPHSGQRRVLGSQDGAFPTSVDTTPHGKSSAISAASRGRQFFRQPAAQPPYARVLRSVSFDVTRRQIHISRIVAI